VLGLDGEAAAAREGRLVAGAFQAPLPLDALGACLQALKGGAREGDLRGGEGLQKGWGHGGVDAIAADELAGRRTPLTRERGALAGR
jgi:hypothetical protein